MEIEGGRGRGNFPINQVYEAVRICDAVPGRQDLNFGGKVFLPELMLLKCLRAVGEEASVLLFKLEANSRRTHCGAIEFTAEPRKIYIPDWIMEHLGLGSGSREGRRIAVSLVDLPRAESITFKPLTSDYMKLDQKVLLEKRLRSFSTLTVGDVIPIEFNGSTYKVSVVEAMQARRCG